MEHGTWLDQTWMSIEEEMWRLEDLKRNTFPCCVSEVIAYLGKY